MIEQRLVDAYRWHRLRGLPAWTPINGGAIARARRDVAEGVRRYPATSAINYNPKFAAYGERHLRFVEDTEAAGLRFLGFADEQSQSINHSGWFADDFQDETYRGAIYQLPARRGQCVYVYGYNDSFNPGSAVLSFDVTDDSADAAIWADAIAERAAEEQREYSAASSARLHHDEMGEEAACLRREALALASEVRRHAVTLEATPGLRAHGRARVCAIRDEILDLYERRGELAWQWDRHAGWRDA